MYERIKYLYRSGLLTETGLDNAMARGWITSEQRAEIAGE